MRRIGPFGIFTGFFTVVRMDLSIVLFSNLDRRMAQRIADLFHRNAVQCCISRQCRAQVMEAEIYQMKALTQCLKLGMDIPYRLAFALLASTRCVKVDLTFPI